MIQIISFIDHIILSIERQNEFKYKSHFDEIR
jgi:hypothetical protein